MSGGGSRVGHAGEEGAQGKAHRRCRCTGRDGDEQHQSQNKPPLQGLEFRHYFFA